MAFSGGTYSIRTALDTSICWDVAGLSNADGVKVQLWSWTGAVDQVWDCTSVGGGYFKVVNGKSGKCAEMIVSDHVEQWAYESGTTQQWQFVDSGETATINGTSYPLYCIKNRININMCADGAGNGSHPSTDVKASLVSSPYATKQLWVCMPTTLPNYELIAPTNGGISLSASKGGADTVNAPTSTTKVYLSWKGSGTRWQVRYRIAVRKLANAALGSYGTWKCLANGSTVNNGWGVPGTLCTTSTSGGRVRASEYVPITLGSTNDLVSIQFEVRRFEPNSIDIGGTLFDGRGTAASFSGKVVADVTVGVSDMVWTPEGVYITPVPSNGRDGNTYKIYINSLSKKWQTFAGVANGDYCVIDSDNIKKQPVSGQSYTVQVRLTTADGAEASTSASVTCSYDADYGLTLSPTITNVGSAARTNLSAYPVHHVWVVTDDYAYEMRDDASGRTWIAPPLGVPYTVMVQADDGNGSWGVWSQAYAAKPVDMHHFVYEGGVVDMRLNRDDAPLLNVGAQTNINASIMTGGTFEAVSAGEGRMESGSLSAAVRYTVTEAEAVRDALVDAVYCWYQGTRGQLWRVAIESIDTTQSHPQYAELTVAWRRTDA